MGKYEKILQRAEAFRAEIVGLRRHFHQHPELGLQEFETAATYKKLSFLTADYFFLTGAL